MLILMMLFLLVQAKSDSMHKKASATKYAEDEEIHRVPLAVAMVKLLKHLPGNSLDCTLPKYVMALRVDS